MNIIDIRAFSEDAVVGPEHGAARLFIWCTTALAGQVVGLHRHNGEEFVRVLYGKLRFWADGQVNEIGPGEVVIVRQGVRHGYITLEDAEIEIYGEMGSGVFISTREQDGTTHEKEIFVRDVPWSRAPLDENQYISRQQQLQQFRADYEAEPFA